MNTTGMDIVMNDGQVVTLKPKVILPPTGLGYYFVLRDWERADFKGTITRPDLPMVFRCGELDNPQNHYFSALTSAWQFFSFNLFSLVFYGMTWEKLADVEYNWLAQKWASTFADATAFANNHGVDIYRNFITRKAIDQNKDKDLPAIATIICGGASLQGEVVLDSKGKKMLKVRHFDANQLPPSIDTINIETDPRIFFATTVTGSEPPDVGCNRFPQLRPKDTPIPLIAMSDIYYPINDLRFVVGNTKPKPYWP
jgi:hypothetical protein